jgi:hypothetical protein
MTLRVCGQPGCPVLVPKGTRSGRCPDHERERDKARGTPAERGYGPEHQRERAALLPEAYGTQCIHCGEYMWPHQALDLDHNDDRTSYRGIVHARCNRSEGGKRRGRRISPDA